MKDFGRQLDDFVAQNPQLRNVSMNSLEYRIMMLLSTHFPTTSEELVEMCYQFISAVYCITLAKTLDVEEAKSLMRLMVETFCESALDNKTMLSLVEQAKKTAKERYGE
jgi:hypothetical protein